VLVHGLLVLLLSGVAAAAVGMVFSRPAQWRHYASRTASYLADRHVQLLAEPQALERELARVRDDFGFELSIYRPDGTLMQSNVTPPLAPLPPGEARALTGEGRFLGNHPPHLAMPLLREGRPVGYLVGRMHASEPDYARGFSVLLAVLATVALVSIPLARSIARPLEHLTDTARRLGAGDLSARSGLRRRDEVGQLAQAFDEMAGRMQALVRREKELLADVSHELRTPMARIRVALEMAAEGDAARAQLYLSEIGVDLAELERLVEDVLAAARLDLATGQAGEGSPPLRRRDVPGEALVERAAERFRAAHPARPLALEVAAPLPVVSADPDLLRRVIDNLLDNARKYSDQQPITLAARGGPEGLLVEVRDGGIGIDAADQPRLFTPFFRTDRSRARGTGGVGLGLALARRIVEAHGGRILVESAPGQGTTVRFHVPALGGARA
jgi:signal transduction histidine kinase